MRAQDIIRPHAFAKQGVAENANAVDINQVASQMKFLPTTKLAKQYKFVKDGVPGKMPAMTYTVASQEQPVVTITSDGKETQNVAAPNDVIMSGPSRENYVVKAAKFPKLYQGTMGGPVIPEQSPRSVALYVGKMPVTFTAPWGESMILKPGDYLVKDGDAGYYRIAKAEYEQTYNQPGSTGQQDITEASGNAAKMARVAKRCARQAFKDTDRPDSKMFLKAAEYFAAGDEKKGLATIARMDTEARDDFYMGCEDAGIPIPPPEPGFLDSLPKLELTPAQEKQRKAMHKAMGLPLDEDSTK